MEGKIYQNIREILFNPENVKEIRKEFPDPDIPRRNTGYAIDILLNTEIFSDSDKKFNFSKLIAGSEGTLAFVTEIKLNLVPLPPEHKSGNGQPIFNSIPWNHLLGQTIYLLPKFQNPGAV